MGKTLPTAPEAELIEKDPDGGLGRGPIPAAAMAGRLDASPAPAAGFSPVIMDPRAPPLTPPEVAMRAGRAVSK